MTRIVRTTQLYAYLNKRNLCDQVHFWGEDEMIFYHWNKAMSNLIPSIVVKGDKIHELKYSRAIMPQIYKVVNATIVNDFTDQKYLRDKRNGQN